MKKDLTKLIYDVKKIVERHKLETGSYSRWSLDNGTGRKMEINEYGCSDAANILYTIGDFPRDISERQSWIQTLQNMQNPDTGLFREATHHPMHTTAHCLAALELLSLDPDASKEMDDLHSLFGAMCCVAELQQFLPGCILTPKPLKLALDRRPFI